MTDRQTILKSIEGITRMIEVKDNTLRSMRNWYLNPKSCNYSYSIFHFYSEGYKLMRQVQQLRKIKYSLRKLIDANRKDYMKEYMRKYRMLNKCA